MIFNSEQAVKKEGTFVFGKTVTAKTHSCIDNATLKEFWKNCSYRLSGLKTEKADGLVFRIGEATGIALEGNDYAVNVTQTGVCIVANTPENLVCGFVTLAQRIRISEESTELLALDCVEIKEKPLVKNRMTHFCVFPDTELWEVEKFVRFCGALKYSHIVLEFWGMFPYECMKKIAWRHAFSKKQLRRIVRIANDFGMEVVPMLNCWGHATASRIRYGRHVVLDQNPALDYLFDKHGWCWNYKRPDVRKLLKAMCEELIEVCGKGEYFHIGCDEAYGFDFKKESIDELGDFINGIAEEMAAKGRRILMWGDMVWSRHPSFNPENPYIANCPNAEAEQNFLQKLDKRIVIADWQYWLKKYPVESALHFQEKGFDVAICPWSGGPTQSDVCIETVKNYGLFGVIHTTWHTLPNSYEQLFRTGVSFWEPPTKNWSELTAQSAACMRKAYFTGGNYVKSGFSRCEVGLREETR